MIIISPYARQLRSGEKNHPKNYPYWNALIPMIKELDPEIIQVGAGFEEALKGISDLRLNLSMKDLAELIKSCKTWVSVDSFFQHYCWDLEKYGIVLWGQSDPVIFGHPENVNLLKSRKYLRDKQFWLWEQTTWLPESFVQPGEVIVELKKLLNPFVTKSPENYCSECGHHWDEHDFGVPAPYCPKS